MRGTLLELEVVFLAGEARTKIAHQATNEETGCLAGLSDSFTLLYPGPGYSLQEIPPQSRGVVLFFRACGAH